MSWVHFKTNPNYEEALKATDSLGGPKGFIYTQETDSPVKASPILAAQNNSQIYLLLKILDKLEDLELRLQKLEKQPSGEEKSDPEIKTALTDIKQKFASLHLGKEAPPQIVRKVYFLQDPQKIIEEELKKIRK